MQTELTQEERHERVLRQFAAKIMFYLPPNDEDARRVLRYAGIFLDGFLANRRNESGMDIPADLTRPN